MGARGTRGAKGSKGSKGAKGAKGAKNSKAGFRLFEILARRRWKRGIAVVFIVLLALAAAGGGVYHRVKSGWSQPCLNLPEGANPGPVTVEGQASGRSGPLTLAFAGDAMLGRGNVARLGQGRARRLFKRLVPALRGADVFAFNLESAITDAPPRGTWKWFRFKLPMEFAQAVLSSIPMSEGATPFASVANNHALDFGSGGLADTLGALDAAGIVHAGAGPDATEAWRPAVVTTVEGVRVGFLAVADHCACLRMGQWVAGRGRSGIAWANLSSGRIEVLRAAVAALDPVVDVLVVSIHSGPNFLPEGRPPWMGRLAETLVNAGADVIWSHSPHHVLPLEEIRGRHVIYGTGGLIDDYARFQEYRSELGMVVRINFSPEGEQTPEIVPIHLYRRGPEALSPGNPDYETVMRLAGVEGHD